MKNGYYLINEVEVFLDSYRFWVRSPKTFTGMELIEWTNCFPEELWEEFAQIAGGVYAFLTKKLNYVPLYIHLIISKRAWGGTDIYVYANGRDYWEFEIGRRGKLELVPPI